MKCHVIHGVVFAVSLVVGAWVADPPPARSGHLLVTAPGGGVLVHGGVSDNAPRLADTLEKWDGRSWQTLTDAGPRARTMAAGTLDTRRGVFVLYGGVGSGSGTRYGDTWEWNGKTWTEANVRTPGP